jgi:predicted DNA-binding ribbon-helix-helix protein
VKTLIIKRSVVLDGHKTSVSLENELWDGLCEIARRESLTTSALVQKRQSLVCNPRVRFQSFPNAWLGSPLASQNKVVEGRGYAPDQV